MVTRMQVLDFVWSLIRSHVYGPATKIGKVENLDTTLDGTGFYIRMADGDDWLVTFQRVEKGNDN